MNTTGKTLQALATLTLLLTISGLAACTQDEASSSQGDASAAAITGEWSSSLCEAYPDGQGNTNYLKRHFTITDETWDLRVDLFGDEACSFGLFSIDISGDYELEDASDVVEGATNGTFGFDSIVWTPHITDMAEVFTQSGCGADEWAVGVGQEVSETGCIGVAHPITDCPREFDIVSVQGDDLFFGQRVTDMCTLEGRPVALNDFAVTRQ